MVEMKNQKRSRKVPYLACVKGHAVAKEPSFAEAKHLPIVPLQHEIFSMLSLALA